MQYEFANIGMTTPIEPEIESEPGILDKLVDGCRSYYEAMTYKGKHYGIPHYAGFMGLMYNKEMFKAAGLDPNKPPRTWDELYDCCKALNNPPKQYAWGHSGNLGNFGWAQAYMNLLINNGGTLYDKKTNRAAFTSGEGLDTLEAQYRLQVDYGVPGRIGAGWDQIRKDFAAGLVAMFPAGVWDFSFVPSINPEYAFENGKWDFTWLPEGSHSTEPKLDAVHGSMLPISAHAKNRKAVWEWTKYNLRPQVNYKHALATGWVPSIKEALSNPEFSKQPYAEILTVKTWVNEWFFPASTELGRKLEVYLEDCLNKKISTKDALAKAETEWNDVLKQLDKDVLG